MRKILVTTAIALAMLTSCTKDDDKTQKQNENSQTQGENTEHQAIINVSLDKTLENTLYPSLIHLSAQKKDFPSEFDFEIQSNANFEVIIKIKNNKFIEETLVRKTLEQGDNTFSLAPNWKYDDMIAINTPGNTHFHFEIIDAKTNKILDFKDLQVSYRSVNECIFGAINPDDNNQFLNLTPFFAAYVNEDAPEIDVFLKEISDYLASNPNFHGWLGEQAGDDGVYDQMGIIVAHLGFNGFTYSNITDTSNTSNYIRSQYVRFVKETIKNKQANCVDGSVLLASIYKKIGLDPYLVLAPGHMYLAIKLPESQNFIFVETTQIGNLSKININSEAEIEQLRRRIFLTSLQGEDHKLISIKDARTVGIKPLQ